MINETFQTNVEDKLYSFTCDKCKNRYTDIFEIQEAIRIKITGGWGSVWGDGTQIIALICQYCFKDMLRNINYQEKDIW